MKSDKLKHKEQESKNLELSEPARSGKKNITTGSGRMHKQYPKKVGYHGTDAEKGLNPEE